jgi:hypothetical protein
MTRLRECTCHPTKNALSQGLENTQIRDDTESTFQSEQHDTVGVRRLRSSYGSQCDLDGNPDKSARVALHSTSKDNHNQSSNIRCFYWCHGREQQKPNNLRLPQIDGGEWGQKWETHIFKIFYLDPDLPKLENCTI